MVMGKHAAILPFKAVGVEIRDVEDIADARAVMREVYDSEEKTLLLVPEDLAVDLRNEIASLRQGVSTVVMTLPASSGEPGIQREQVRQLVARSIGVDLMGRKKD
jgi:vacuolar-type H+-ATPase subunit F/Vma7